MRGARQLTPEAGNNLRSVDAPTEGDWDGRNRIDATMDGREGGFGGGPLGSGGSCRRVGAVGAFAVDSPWPDGPSRLASSSMTL